MLIVQIKKNFVFNMPVRIFVILLIFLCQVFCQTILNNIDVNTCDPLIARGTNVLCTPPKGVGPRRTNCSQPSVPGTIASYACRNTRNEVLRGLLNCTIEGYWISSMSSGNNSLCNLDAAIVNIQSPDVAVALGSPGFTTPSPNQNLLQTDFSNLNDFQRVGLQLHNTFRRNHGVQFVAMPSLMNEVAQDLANFIAFGNSSDVEANKKLSMIHSTSNIEMNWYIQEPMAINAVEAVSNAVQSWYSAGFPEYDWNNVGSNLDKGNVLSFARVIWKATKFMGIGFANFNGVTFVTAIYTPGRHIGNPDPIQEFQSNVLPIRIENDMIAFHESNSISAKLPLNNASLIYISSTLKPEECQLVYAILLVQDSAREMHKNMNISTLREEAKMFQILNEHLKESNKDQFKCYDSLIHWNQNIIGKSIKEKFDKQSIAETILGVALYVVGRTDLENWLHSRIQELKFKEIGELKNEISHHKEDPFWISNNHTTVPKTHDPPGQSHFPFFLMVVVTCGISLVIITCIVIACCSDPTIDSIDKQRHENTLILLRNNDIENGKSKRKAAAVNSKGPNRHELIYLLENAV